MRPCPVHGVGCYGIPEECAWIEADMYRRAADPFYADPRPMSVHTDETRARALEVLGNTDTWTGSDWQHAAIQLASAVVAVTGDIDKVPQ